MKMRVALLFKMKADISYVTEPLYDCFKKQSMTFEVDIQHPLQV